MSEFAYPQTPITQLTFNLTGGRGPACWRCPTPEPHPTNGNGKHFLPLETMHQAIQEALPLGLRAVRLGGGDPLLHPQIHALLDLLESFEVSLSIETGGAGMNQALAAHLARLPQTRIMIGLSHLADPPHNGGNGRSSTFETAVQAARLLSDAGLPPQIILLLTRQNASQLTNAIQLAEKWGARSVQFVTAQPEPSLHQASWNPNLLTVEELIALGRKVERELASSTRLSLIFDQPLAFRGLQPQTRLDSQEHCTVLNSLSVLVTGEYALCGLASATSPGADGLIFGKVGADPLARIWFEHPILLALHEGMPERLEGVCGRCMLKSACLGHCVAGNYLRSGSLWGPYWFCEAAERAGLFPAGRLIENRW